MTNRHITPVNAFVPWTDDDVDQSIARRFESQASLHATRVAVRGRSGQWTYEELNREADRIARTLLASGIGAGCRVALLASHDKALPAAILGIYKSGSVCVPLSFFHPESTLASMIADAGADVLLTDSQHAEAVAGLAGEGRELINMDDLGEASPAHDAPPALSPDAPAYIIYTSGSTGRPLGVLQTHRNVLSNVKRLTNGLHIHKDDRVCLLASASTGQGMATVLWTLLNGAVLCLHDLANEGFITLAEWMVREEISIFISAATIFRHFIATLGTGASFPRMRVVRLGAETVHLSDHAGYRAFFPDSCLFANTYSSTETGNLTQFFTGKNAPSEWATMPVGYAAEDVTIDILDDAGDPVAAGQPGEIVVTGRYLSPGYWGDTKLTTERFRPSTDGRRIFHTRDIGVMHPDGCLEHLGRRDSRVKIHGFYVSPEAVRGLLCMHPDVSDAMVIADVDENGNARLVGFVVPRSGAALTAAELRRHLLGSLPAHAVPARITFLPALPRTPNGKVDVASLKKSVSDRVTDADAPRSGLSPAESLLVDLWGRALNLQDIWLDENFFEAGGDSLSAAVVAAQIHAEWSIAIDLREFADHPTIRQMARLVERRKLEVPSPALPPLVRASRDRPLPLSLVQERIWRYSRTPESAAGYLKAVGLRITGPLNADAFRWSIGQVFHRHEILRTAFIEIDGAPVQDIQQPGPVDIPFIDLSAEPDAYAVAWALLREKSGEPCELSRAPLLRMWLVRVHPDEHLLLRVHHNIISDGLSWAVFFRDLGFIYEARLRDEPSCLSGELPLQYGDFAAWQRLCLQPGTPSYEAQISWWADFLQSLPPSQKAPFLRPAAQADAAPADGVIEWGLPASLTVDLERMARETGTTFYMIRLAAFSALLLAESGQPEIVIGTHVTNRNRVETQEMFGFFLNMVPLRLRASGGQSFKDWLGVVKHAVIETQSRSEIPYEQICEELRRKNRIPPDIQIIFGLSGHTPAVRMGGLEIVTAERISEGMPWGFSMSFDKQDEAGSCKASFDARLYDPARVRNFIGILVRFLNSASHDPDRTLESLVGGDT